MNGQDIVRRVYQRLRRPSQQSLPYQVVLQTVAEVIARKKLDLALSPQNSLATTSRWFTPASTDFALETKGMSGILLPIRVERRSIGSDWETGEDVPIVNYEVLNTSLNGAISFYGDPVRMVFRDGVDYVTQQEYRVIYEADFEEEFNLRSILGLPAYFAGMVVLEAAWELSLLVDDSSPEWQAFLDRSEKRWATEIADKREGWAKFVRMFRGRATVPKRTFWTNQVQPFRRYFKG